MGNVNQICEQVEPNSQFQNERDKIINTQNLKQSGLKIQQTDNIKNKQQQIIRTSITPKIKQASFNFCDNNQIAAVVLRDKYFKEPQTHNNNNYQKLYNQTQGKTETQLIKNANVQNLINTNVQNLIKLSIRKGGKNFIYQGQLSNNQMQGYGKIIDQLTNKVIYDGQFKHNTFDGWGFTQFYEGEFKLSKYQGYGIYKQFLGIKPDIITTFYEGYFRKGCFQGKGIYLKNCRLSISELDRIHSLGVFNYIYSEIQHNMQVIKKFQVQEIYIGQFSNGLKHGYGRLFKQNFQFCGQLSHDLYHGLGTSFFNAKNGGQKAIQTIYRMGKQLQNQ